MAVDNQEKARRGRLATGRAAKLVTQVQRAKDKLRGLEVDASLRALGPLWLQGMTVRQAMAKLARDIRKARHA